MLNTPQPARSISLKAKQRAVQKYNIREVSAFQQKTCFVSTIQNKCAIQCNILPSVSHKPKQARFKCNISHLTL